MLKLVPKSISMTHVRLNKARVEPVLTWEAVSGGSFRYEIHFFRHIFMEMPLVQQQIVLLIGPVHTVGALEARLFPTFVLYVPLQ